MKIWKDYIWAWCWALIVNDKNEILLIKRTWKSTWWGWVEWARPWWCIEFWETIKEALKREVKEELWIEIELFWPIYYLDDIREENWEQIHWIWGGAFARIVSWKIVNLEPDKHEEVKWFSLNNLPEKIAEYSMQGIIEYKEYVKTKQM